MPDSATEVGSRCRVTSKVVPGIGLLESLQPISQKFSGVSPGTVDSGRVEEHLEQTAHESSTDELFLVRLAMDNLAHPFSYPP